MKKILLKENELIKLIGRITEEVDMDEYEDEDFLDAFFVFFRNWLRRKLGSEANNYPMSFLLKKHGKDFVIETLGQEYFSNVHGDEENFEIDKFDAIRIGQDLVKKKLHNLPTLKQKINFLEKYKKYIPSAIERLELPDYATVTFQEKTPQKLSGTIHVDFPKMMKSQDKKNISFYGAEEKFKDFFTNFLGVEFGNPVYGKVSFERFHEDLQNVDDWVKNELNGKIKKEIRNLDTKKVLHSIRFEPENSQGIIKLIFKGHLWYGRVDLRNQILERLTEMGYNMDKLKVKM